MSQVAFFCDEDVPAPLIACLAKFEPAMTVVAVGQPGMPPKGTLDPELLRFAESMGYTLLSRDKKTMRGHVAAHLAAGHHTWGVFLLKEDRPLMAYVNDLLLIWSLSQAEDWVDQIEYLPW
jgi:hypothetical protein